MFIHWGYAVPASTYNDKKVDGIGKWIMNQGKPGEPLTSLKDFLRYAYYQELTQTDLSVLLKSLRLFSFENLPESPNWEDIHRLIDYYGGNKTRDIRNKAIIIIFAVYGIRCSELENLTLRDVDWKNTIYLQRAKRCRPKCCLYCL